ncbi:hypothetical protein PYCC9005_005830 [Savitreella phatthalungensis]
MDTSQGPGERHPLDRELFHLQRLNSTLERVLSSLSDASSNVGEVDGTVRNADRLLDLYVRVLDRADAAHALVLDPSWKGASADLASTAAAPRPPSPQPSTTVTETLPHTSSSPVKSTATANPSTSDNLPRSAPTTSSSTGVRTTSRGRGRARGGMTGVSRGGTMTTTTTRKPSAGRSSLAPPTDFLANRPSALARDGTTAPPSTRGRGVPAVRGTRASRGRQVVMNRTASGGGGGS